jgi:hypothetical protein
VRQIIQPFDARALCYPWRSADPELDLLAASIQETVKREEQRSASRREIFRTVWELAGAGEFPREQPRAARATIPYLTEPWYC